jgi:hypothetical protein
MKDHNGTAINEYFDIPENAWGNNNLSAALDEAQDMCLSLRGFYDLRIREKQKDSCHLTGSSCPVFISQGYCK